MERLTYVTENGEVLFHPADLPDDEGMTITQLAENGRYKDLEEIAERLANREQAEEQGLRLRLPCKVGDIVWEVNTERKRISKFLIETITVYPCNVIQFNWTLLEGIYKNVVGFSKAELGTTVFLTREEAEAKLKGVEEKESKDVSAWKNHIINRFMREE